MGFVFNKKIPFISFNYIANPFTYSDRVIVKVFFVYKIRIYQYKNIIRKLEFKKQKNANEDYYLDEAKKIIEQEIKDGSLIKFSKKYIVDNRNKKLRIAIPAILCACAAIVGPTSYSVLKRFNEDVIHKNETIVITQTVSFIEDLSPDSTIEEINRAVDEYNALPEELKAQISQETKDYLYEQVKLYENDEVESNKVNDQIKSFTIEDTTESEVKKVEAEIRQLTKRATTMLRSDWSPFLSKIKGAIEVDKTNAYEINDRVSALDEETATVEEATEIIRIVYGFSTRALSYVSQKAIDKMYSLVGKLEGDDEVARVYASFAKGYATAGSECSLEDINILQAYYNALSERAKKYADEYGFSKNIAIAKDLYFKDNDDANKILSLVSALDPATCFDRDIDYVEQQYKLIAVNNRIKNLATKGQYEVMLQAAKTAFQIDVDKTKNKYNELIQPIKNVNCSQDDITLVTQNYNNYLSQLNKQSRLYKLITEGKYNLRIDINNAQISYNEDLKTAKTVYETQVAKLGANCTKADIDSVQTYFNNYKKNVKPRILGFLQSGAQYDLQAKIDSALNLYNIDKGTAKIFDDAAKNVPDTSFERLTTEEKMLMESAKTYRDDGYYVDGKYHSFINDRSRSLVDPSLSEKINRLRKPELFKLALLPSCSALSEGDKRPFDCDNNITLDSAVGFNLMMYRHNYDVEPVLSKIWDEDYQNVIVNQNSYNYVSFRVLAHQNCLPASSAVNEAHARKIQLNCYKFGETKHSKVNTILDFGSSVYHDTYFTASFNLTNEYKTQYRGVEIRFDNLADVAGSGPYGISAIYLEKR